MIYLWHTGEGTANFDGSPERRKNTMAVSKSQQKAVHKYVKANYDRMELTVPKGQKDAIKAYAAALGESVNGFVSRVIMEVMARDGGGRASEIAQQAAGTPQGAVVSLPSDALETARTAADAAGESMEDFLRRAVETQEKRDKASFKLGINPATGDKLEQNGKGGASHE